MASAHSPFTHTDLPPVRSKHLHLAVLRDDVKRVRQRLSQGDEVDTFCGDLVDGTYHVMTPLILAAGKGNKKICEILLNSGANPSAVDSSDGSSVLHVAAVQGHLEIVTMLINAGADVDSTDHKNRTALACAAGAGYDKVVEALLSAHAAVDMAGCGGCAPLMTAAMHGQEKCVRLLLKAGADVSKVASVKGTDGYTPLYAAALEGHVYVVQALLSGGAGVDTATSRGRTPFFAAAAAGRTSSVKLLLDAGADPQIRDEDNATALMNAINLPTVKVLLEAGLSATAVDYKGHTVLHHMGGQGCSSAVICAMFREGANPTLLNKAGQTAADVAREQGNIDAATLLDMLAAKYTQDEQSALEGKEKPSSTVVPSEDVAESDVQMEAACVVDSTNDKVDAGLAECSQDIEEEQKHKTLRPCLNCQTLTHRRCARCRTAYICSHDCQVATLAEHRVKCMKIYETRERAKAERKAAKRQEESG